jgi:hypothetical protein
MAENKRFELLISCDIHAFQACALDHYANSPFDKELKLYKIRLGLIFCQCYLIKIFTRHSERSEESVLIF